MATAPATSLALDENDVNAELMNTLMILNLLPTVIL